MTTANPSDRINRRFDYLRQQTQQDANKNQQLAMENLERQAASRGRLGSGAFQKLRSQAGDQLADQRNKALEGVESQRDVALGQQEELQAQRDFSRGEREASQKFGAEQALLQRQHASGERAAAQRFASGERLAGQRFTAQQNAIQQAFKEKVFSTQTDQWLQQFEQAKKQWMIEQSGYFNVDEYGQPIKDKDGNIVGGRTLDSQISDFNKEMAKRQADQNDRGFMEQLMGDTPFSGQYQKAKKLANNVGISF